MVLMWRRFIERYATSSVYHLPQCTKVWGVSFTNARCLKNQIGGQVFQMKANLDVYATRQGEAIGFQITNIEIPF